MRITPYIEQLVHEGKAQYKTISMGACQEMVIPVPNGTYIIITGYEYLPIAPLVGTVANVYDTISKIQDAIQYVNFVNDSNFYPFSHPLLYIGITAPVSVSQTLVRADSYQHRDTYIISKKNIAVYFTRMTPTTLTLTSDVLVQNPPIFDGLGYVATSAVTEIQNYNDNALGRVNPLTDPYTVPQYTPNQSNYNQLYTIPIAGGFIDMSSLTTPGSPLGKARANHIIVHYFEINEQPPSNLI
jgi:hypothetical protein